jgi:hypothetical protein
MSQQPDTVAADLCATTLASDSERDAVVAILNDGFAQGRLTSDEHADRSTRALTARTYGELDQVLVGLLLPTATRTSHPVAKSAFWILSFITSPFWLLGVLLLTSGQDAGDRIGGIFLLALFVPGLVALQRWAWPRADGAPWLRRR